MPALLTDLYQLTMAAGYFEAGKVRERATFELFVRRLPANRNFLIAAGLEQAVEYLRSFRFTSEEIAYLRGLQQFERVSPAFFDYLAELRFTGDLFAVPEGTPVFAGEPILTVRAPLIEAQIPETYLLSTITFQTLVATKAARITGVSAGRSVVEFGTRRAHSPEAGTYAARAAYIGGCLGTSNTLAGMRYGIPVFGTTAHSWIQSFPTELEAFQRLQRMLGEKTVYLIDTYDTVDGARTAASLGKPLWGVRIDSGNLAELSRAVRSVLDAAGLHDAKIMASGDLNEDRIRDLLAAEAPIDSFGVGTDLATSNDLPSLSAVYKLVEIRSGGKPRFTAKFSAEKVTLAGSKQIFRFANRDLVSCSWECVSCTGAAGACEALLKPVMLGGELVEALPSSAQVRDYARDRIAALPAALRTLSEVRDQWPVEYSEELLELNRRIREDRMGARPQ